MSTLPRKPFPATVSPYATGEVRRRVFAARLPPVRPLQPSQWDPGAMVRIRYRLQVLRDRWQIRRGRIIDGRCKHCWKVLNRFTPLNKIAHHETMLKTTGEPLAKLTWWECSVCDNRTADGYCYKPYPSAQWGAWVSYKHSFGR